MWKGDFIMPRIMFAIAFAAMILLGRTTAEAEQTPGKSATAKKNTAPDLSILTAFRDALLDLKGAVEAGVNREDYQRKLQTAVGESFKAEARLPDDEASPGVVRHCFYSYGIALSQYRIAASKWGVLLTRRKGNEEGLPGYDDATVTRAEEDLQASWRDADRALDKARSCIKAKSD